MKVADYVDVSGSHDSWKSITLGDCLNMATGIGDGQSTPEPLDIHADNKTNAAEMPDGAANYRLWYDQPSAAGKLKACLNYGDYPWGPGEVVRYRDPDLFMTGVVMDAFYKSVEGPESHLWDMMMKDVYRPLGIYHLPMNHTVEPDGSRGVPCMAVGMFVTIDDLAKIARLFQQNGQIDDKQVLSPGLLVAATDTRTAKGLPTGDHTPDGSITYHMAFWHYPYRAGNGQMYFIPAMRGYGGNIVQLLPNGMSTFRIANDTVSARQPAYDPVSFIRLADSIQPF